MGVLVRHTVIDSGGVAEAVCALEIRCRHIADTFSSFSIEIFLSLIRFHCRLPIVASRYLREI